MTTLILNIENFSIIHKKSPKKTDSPIETLGFLLTPKSIDDILSVSHQKK